VAISFVAAGAASATADTSGPIGTTSYELPAGVVEDNLLIVGAGNKPFSAEPSPPAEFSTQATVTNGTVANAGDGGSVRAGAFTRTMVAGDGAPSFTWSAYYSPQIGAMIGLSKENSGAWAVTATTGFDNSTGTTSFLAAAPANLNYAVGDWAVAVVMVPTDAGVHTSPALSIPGCTVANLTARVNQLTTQGLDGRCYIYTADITAGTSTGAPSYTATGTSGATGSAQGSVVFLRVVEPAGGTDATVTPATVEALATVGLVVVSTAAGAAAFTVGQSMVGGIDVLGFGATEDVWATVLPNPVAATATVPAPALWGPPTGLIATPISTDQIDLSWNPVLGASGYDVERDGVVIAFDVAATSYQDTGLDPGTSYDYRIRSVEAA
jgi:hypothetical protein